MYNEKLICQTMRIKSCVMKILYGIVLGHMKFLHCWHLLLKRCCAQTKPPETLQVAVRRQKLDKAFSASENAPFMKPPNLIRRDCSRGASSEDNGILEELLIFKA
jgi:hypothetical protein